MERRLKAEVLMLSSVRVPLNVYNQTIQLPSGFHLDSEEIIISRLGSQFLLRLPAVPAMSCWKECMDFPMILCQRAENREMLRKGVRHEGNMPVGSSDFLISARKRIYSIYSLRKQR